MLEYILYSSISKKSLNPIFLPCTHQTPTSRPTVSEVAISDDQKTHAVNAAGEQHAAQIPCCTKESD
jgi:hypothetical protein